MGVTRLGHVGIYCDDLMKMRDFYSRVVGLTITDEDHDLGIVFLSANPEWEHHELALAKVREGMGATQFVQQLSFKIDSLDDLRDFTHRLEEEPEVRIERTVTHGISCSVYFFDPEENRVELYYTTPYNIRQPLGAHIDVDSSDKELLEYSESFLTTMGPPQGATR